MSTPAPTTATTQVMPIVATQPAEVTLADLSTRLGRSLDPATPGRHRRLDVLAEAVTRSRRSDAVANALRDHAEDLADALIRNRVLTLTEVLDR